MITGTPVILAFQWRAKNPPNGHATVVANEMTKLVLIQQNPSHVAAAV